MPASISSSLSIKVHSWKDIHEVWLLCCSTVIKAFEVGSICGGAEIPLGESFSFVGLLLHAARSWGDYSGKGLEEPDTAMTLQLLQTVETTLPQSTLRDACASNHEWFDFASQIICNGNID